MKGRTGVIALGVVAVAMFVSACGHNGRVQPLVNVPDLTSGHGGLERAYSAIRAAGLTVSVVRFPTRYNQRDTFGVSSQSPRAGSKVPPGSTVTVGGPYLHLLASLPGMAGRRPVGGMTTVPNVTGLPIYAALARLQNAGVYSQLTRIPPLRRSARQRLFDAYIVRAQSPAAGTRVRWAGILYTSSHGGAVDIGDSQVTLVPALK